MKQKVLNSHHAANSVEYETERGWFAVKIIIKTRTHANMETTLKFLGG